MRTARTPASKHAITPADVLPMEEYAKVRLERRRAAIEMKRDRRLAVGPFVVFTFESYDTMWRQVHEMLFVEKGGAAQVAGELEAYNALIPQGSELVATVMLEIPDEDHRRAVLARLGGIEETFRVTVDGEAIAGRAERDVDRTTAEGKTSAVHFVHFPFTADQIAKFRAPGARATVAVAHPNYTHEAVMPEATRAVLAGDFD